MIGSEVVGPLTMPGQTYIVMVLMSIVAVIAITGNILIVTLFLKLKRIAKITPHTYLTNLALADLILGLKLPFFFLITLAKGDEWVLVDGTCVAVGALDSFAIRLVVAGMTSIAVDRYIAVIHALRYNDIMTEKRAIVIIVIIWLYSLFWSLLPVMISPKKAYIFSRPHNMCMMVPYDKQFKYAKIFITIDLLLNYIVPLTIMTICYWLIGKEVLSKKQVGLSLRRFIRTKSLKKSLDKGENGHPNEGIVGIKIDMVADKSKDSKDLSEESEEDEYIEYPAITKSVADMMGDTERNTQANGHTGCGIQEMYKKTGLEVRSNGTMSKFGMDSGSNPATRRGSWAEEGTTAIKDGARRLSTTVTNSVMGQIKRLSQASTAFSKMSKYQMKIARTTLVVYFSFFCCFTPYIAGQIILLLHPSDMTHTQTIFMFSSVCLVFTSACINVIIYGTMHRNIRSTLRGLFHI